MKILHFLGIGRLPKQPLAEATGGTERTVLEVARIQRRRGFDVTVACKGDVNWRGSWEGVKLLHIAPFVAAKALSAGRITGAHLPLTWLIYKENYDLVHFHEYTKTTLLAARCTVMHFHNDPLPGCDDAALAREAPSYWSKIGKSARQIGVSDYLTKRLRLTHDLAGHNAPGANIVKVSNGVHVDATSKQSRAEARRRMREAFGFKETDVVFLFCGALRPEKGVDYLARAFAKLSRERADVRLIVAGGGRLWVESGWLQSEAIDSWDRRVADILAPAIAQKRAFLPGIVPPDEIMPFYAASDVLVLPSMFQETFGLVILEAFSVGLPVVAFRSGGIPELVKHQTNGILVEQGDEQALYQSMRELTLDRNLRERLGGAGEDLAPAYSWEKTADQISSVYVSALETGPRRARRQAQPRADFGREPR